jgi:hypothetical protein
MEYVCIRRCYFQSRRYDPEERVSLPKGEDVPRHFVPVKEYRPPEPPPVPEAEVPPPPNAELHFDKERNVYVKDIVMPEEERKERAEKKRQLAKSVQAKKRGAAIKKLINGDE